MHSPDLVSPIALVRVALLLPVVRIVTRMGARVKRLLHAADIPTPVLDLPDALVSLHQACRFMQASVRETGIENLGLLAGYHLRFDMLGTFGGVVGSARTLDEAIQTAMRAMPAFAAGGRCQLVDEGERVRLSHEFAHGLHAEYAGVDQFRFMLSLGLVLQVAEPRRPRGNGLRIASSGAFGDIKGLPGVRLYLGDNVLSFPRALLSRPLVGSQAARRIDDVEVAAWKASGPAGDFSGSLLQLVATLSSPTYPRIGRVADAIGMSVRALQRRLAEKGVSYGQLLDRSRFTAAVDLLERTDSTVLDVALDVGYSDHAHFTRAFRRWTGLAPRDFRRESRRMHVEDTRQVSIVD